MIIRCCVTLLHLLMLVNEVSLQDSTLGVVGTFAVLPCSAKEPTVKHEDITVNWRYEDNLNVYTITKGKGSVIGQDPKYRNRTETFSEGNKNGNFSLKLNNLQLRDGGIYQCYIITQQEPIVRNVELLIKVPWKLSLNGSVGGSVDLPCSSNQKSEGITVQWRHNGNLNVYEIIKGKDSLEKQDSAYVGRTKSFPEAYMNGNYSLTLSNLTLKDTGSYTCYITKDFVIHTMELVVNDVKSVHSRPQKMATVMYFLSLFILLI